MSSPGQFRYLTYALQLCYSADVSSIRTQLCWVRACFGKPKDQVDEHMTQQSWECRILLGSAEASLHKRVENHRVKKQVFMRKKISKNPSTSILLGNEIDAFLVFRSVSLFYAGFDFFANFFLSVMIKVTHSSIRLFFELCQDLTSAALQKKTWSEHMGLLNLILRLADASYDSWSSDPTQQSWVWIPLGSAEASTSAEYGYLTQNFDNEK